MEFDTQLKCQQWFLNFQKMFPGRNFEFSYSKLTAKYKIDFSTVCQEDRDNIIKIEDLGYAEEDQFVYDIETDNGKFVAGIGNIVLFNTDSVFIKFKTEFNEKLVDAYNKGDQEKIAEYSEKSIEKSFELGKKAALEATKELFKEPIKLEFEKVYLPLVLIGKKRYVGQLYANNPAKPDYYDYKGVELKRTDCTKLVKKMYQKLIDIVMTKGPSGVAEAKEYIRNLIDDMISERIDVEDLIVSKTLKDGYKTPNIPHKKLAQKIYKRDLQTKSLKDLQETSKLYDCQNKEKIVDFLVNEYSWTLSPSWKAEDLSDMKDKDLLKLAKSFGNFEDPDISQKSEIITKLTRNKTALPGNAPKLNEKIPYVYIDIGNPRANQYEIVEDPEYYMKNKNTLKINVLYYLEHQLKTPIVQFLGAIDPSVEGFVDNIVKKLKPVKAVKVPAVKKQSKAKMLL